MVVSVKHAEPAAVDSPVAKTKARPPIAAVKVSLDARGPAPQVLVRQGGIVDQARLPEIAAGFYDAIAAPEAWPAVLREASVILGAEGAAVASDTPGQGSYQSSPRMQALVASYFGDNWHARNPWPKRMACRGLMDSVVTEWLLFSPEELRAQPVYTEWALRHGISSFMSVVLNADDGLLFFGSCRTPAQGRFTREEVNALGRIVPSLRQAAGLATRLAAARDSGAADLLGQMTRGAILVDCRGRVLRLNAAAERFLGDAITVAGGELIARHGGANDALRAQIGRAVQAPSRPATARLAAAPDGPVALPRPAGRPLLAEVVPLNGASGDLFRRARAIVFLTDPDERIAVEENACQRLFGLSPAEARLAIAISHGEDPADFAETAGLALDTVRKRIKAVLAKTGTRRQAQLSALVGRLRRDVAAQDQLDRDG